MTISITSGRIPRLLWTGGDHNPASTTVGMTVIHHSRDATETELAEHAALLARVAAAPVNPEPGQESYGAAHDALRAWLRARPREIGR